MSIQDSASTDRGRSFVEEARRRQIVEAAIDVIAESSYPNASFARIAERARISPSLIAYHFRSKAELDRAIGMSIHEDLDGSVSRAAAGATSHGDAVRRIIVGFVDYVDRNRNRMLALRQLDLALGPDERAGIGVLDESSGIGSWVELLAAGQRAGEFRSFDVRSAALGIMGLLSGVPREVIRNPSADARQLGAELATLVLTGIARSESPVARKRRAAS